MRTEEEWQQREAQLVQRNNELLAERDKERELRAALESGEVISRLTRESKVEISRRNAVIEKVRKQSDDLREALGAEKLALEAGIQQRDAALALQASRINELEAALAAAEAKLAEIRSIAGAA
jgi:hypothetical protein